MGKLNGVRVNIGYTNESSVSNYYSDNAFFRGESEKSSSSFDNSAISSYEKSTTHIGEDADGPRTIVTGEFSRTVNYGISKDSATAETGATSNFVTTVFTRSFKAGTTVTATETNSLSVSKRTDRFGNSTEGKTTGKGYFTRSGAFSATTPYGNTGDTFKRSNSARYTRKAVTSISINSTTTGFSAGTTGASGSSRTRKFITRDSNGQNPGVSVVNIAVNNPVNSNPDYTPTISARDISRIRTARSYTQTSTLTTTEKNIPATFETESTVVLTNESLLPSTFSYTQNVTTWTTSSTSAKPTIIPSFSSESFYDWEDTFQFVVSSLYQEGGVFGYVPLESLQDWSVTDFDVSVLTSSISYWNGYLPNRNDHEQTIAVGSNDNQGLTWHDQSQLYYDEEGETSESTTYSYNTEEKNNIVTTELSTTGDFYFGKTTDISTQYTTTTTKATNFTELSSSTRTGYVQTFITGTQDGLATATAADIGYYTTSNSTYYLYSSKADSSSIQTFAKTTSHKIGFFRALASHSYSSTYFVIDREKYPFFRLAYPNVGGQGSLISIKWGGFDAFQSGTNSTRVTGIPKIDFTDQSTVTFSTEVTDRRTVNTQQNVQTSSGTGMVGVVDNYLTTETFVSNVEGNTVTETEYTLQRYDNTYKLNRYFTYIPVNDTLNYVSNGSSFESTNDESLSVTYTTSQILALGSLPNDPTTSYSKELFGIRKEGQFSSVVTRESPVFHGLKTNPFGGENFADSAGTLFLTGNELDRDFDPTIFTSTASTDYITFDLNNSHVISSTIEKHIILRMKNTHGLLKEEAAYFYINEGEFGDRAPIGIRYFFAYEDNRFPECPIR